MKPSKRWIIVMTVIAIVLISGPFILQSRFRVPPDAELVSRFNTRKTGFVALKDMLVSEPTNIVGIVDAEVMFKETWTRVSPEKAGMDRARFACYKQIMKNNDVKEVWRYEQEICLTSGFQGWGFGGKGPRLSYVYRTSAPTNQLRSLDQFTRTGKRMTIAYRPVSEDWYIRLVW